MERLVIVCKDHLSISDVNFQSPERVRTRLWGQ